MPLYFQGFKVRQLKGACAYFKYIFLRSAKTFVIVAFQITTNITYSLYSRGTSHFYSFLAYLFQKLEQAWAIKITQTLQTYLEHDI